MVTDEKIFCSGLFHAGGMGLWHGVEHWERNKIMTSSDTEMFYETWPKVRNILLRENICHLSIVYLQALKENTEFKYDWSYFVAWIGVGLALIASILFSLAAVCIR